MKTTEKLHFISEATAGVRWRIIAATLCGMSRIASALCFVWVCKQLVDYATGRHNGSFAMLVTLMVACMVLQLLFANIAARIESLSTVMMRNRLRHQLFSHLMECRWEADRYHTGDAVNRMQDDSQTLAAMACMSVPSLLMSLLQFTAAFVFLAALDIHLAWILVLVMPATLLLGRVYMRGVRRLTRDIRKIDSETQELIQEHLQHRILLRSMESTRQSARSLAALHKALLHSVTKRTDYSLSMRTCMQAGFMAGYVLAFLWGICGILEGSVSFGMMTAFLQLVAQVQRPVVDIGQKLHFVAQTMASVERMAELFELPEEEHGNAVVLEGPAGLCFRHVCFSYPGSGETVVSDFSHDFKPGTATAIVGETGIGKTTLVRLALALLTPDKGHVTLYNKEREMLASPMTRCNIAYVPQGNTLMSGSIRDNLLLGNPAAGDADMEKALRGAAADFVFGLPRGIDTICGEKGAGLSEGQAQRIAIARGLLRKGGILLLDEPAASLDAETEALLFERLKEHLKDKTLIVVTHRGSAERMCSETVRIGKG